MFFSRKRNKDNSIYPNIHKQARHDGIKDFVESSKIYKKNIRTLNMDEEDVNLYLSYTFAKYTKELNELLESFQSELREPQNRINAQNIYKNGYKVKEVFNQERDALERKNLIEVLSIINKNLLVNTPFLDMFMDMDNKKARIFEDSSFKKNPRNSLYVFRDKVMDTMMPRDMLPQMVFQDLCSQINEYMIDNSKLPSARNINSNLIEDVDMQEFLDTIRANLFYSRNGYNKFADTGRIESLMNKNQKQEFINLVDVFIPGEAGIDENSTIELIAKSMVWNNRLAKVTGGIHGDIVRNLARRTVETDRTAEALDDVYEELQQTDTQTKDGTYSTALEDFIRDYTDYLSGKFDEDTLRRFYSSQSVFKACQHYCGNKSFINQEKITLQSMYEYLSSRNAENFLYYAKDFNMSLLIDETAKMQRMGTRAVKLNIQTDPNVDEDKVSVSLSIRGKNGKYRVHGLKKLVNEYVNKKQNRNLRYGSYEPELPIDFSVIYSLSPEQQIEVLHLLAEKDVKPIKPLNEKERGKRDTRIKMLTYYANDILNEIRASGSQEERDRVNAIAGKQSFTKIVAGESGKGKSKYYAEEPKSITLRKEMLKMLYARKRTEKDRTYE